MSARWVKKRAYNNISVRLDATLFENIALCLCVTLLVSVAPVSVAAAKTESEADKPTVGSIRSVGSEPGELALTTAVQRQSTVSDAKTTGHREHATALTDSDLRSNSSHALFFCHAWDTGAVEYVRSIWLFNEGFWHVLFSLYVHVGQLFVFLFCVSGGCAGVFNLPARQPCW